MYYFRLIKPNWGIREITKEIDGKKTKVPNPAFVREILGDDTIGDSPMTPEYLEKMNSKGYGIYFFPNHPSKELEHKYINGRDVDTFNFVFVDMDLKDKVYASKEEFLNTLSSFPVKPSMTVDSGNGIHAYWSISELNRDFYIHTQLVLIQHFKTDGSIWTPMQLMRYPGSKNTKNPEQFKDVLILDDFSSGETNSLDSLLAHLPPISSENEKRMARHIAMLEGREAPEMDLTNPDELPARFKKDLERNLKMKDLFERPKETCGDRSTADMKLANLLFSLDYDKQEALQVLVNTQKARSRADRAAYAFNTVHKVYTDRPKYSVGSAAERRSIGAKISNLGRHVHGPEYWDCLEGGWRTKQVLGLIGGSGVGKTTVTLNMFKAFIENNPDSDEIFVFFSLEMTEGEIYEEWDRIVQGNEDMFKRLYVVSNEDDEGNPRNIGLQELLWFCKDIRKSSGKKINSIAVDHLDAISRHLDLSKKDTFNFKGMDKEQGYRQSDTVTIGKGAICAKFKELCKELDVFGILQSQTTKAKDGGGDLPLGKNAAHGESKFEWYVDYIITIWRPTKRVQDRTKLKVLAWQYAKIRRQRKGDRAQEGTHYLLKFDMDTGTFSTLTNTEEETIKILIADANALRQAETKNVTVNYQNSPEIVKKLQLIYSNKETKPGN